MDKILKQLNIDETKTKPPKKQKIFNKIKDNIPLIENYNFMADLLHLPTTKKGFSYCYVMVDLADNNFDIEPIKNKEPNTCLNAMKAIFKRKILKKPYASIATDSGTEFKGVYNKYLENEGIDHKVGLPYRHKQVANVESLNKQLGRLFNGYMNSKEEETGKPYNEWTDIIDIVRKELNKFREKKISNDPFTQTPNFDLEATPKFKKGDIVYYKTEIPLDAFGNKQPTLNFRVGDYRFNPDPREIVAVLYYPKTPSYRYMLNDITNVSFDETELKLADKEKHPKFKVKEIIGRKKTKGKVYYLVWWKGYKKDEATYEPRENLIDDGLENLLNDFDNKVKH